MLSQKVERIRSIKSFPSLVKYLRDELDWPIESEDFDDLTFDYEPEELGIDSRIAVKIKDIKQLRPLSSRQPWGIFFINFEPKRLPIVKHGGWPDAFQNKEEEYKVQTEPARKVAEKKPEQYIPKTSNLTHKSIPSSKNDWKTWQSLSTWAKTAPVNTYWINFASSISNKIKNSSKLSQKDQENMRKCWKQAVKNGFQP